ncbi:hypothetical protein IKD48_00730 [bacterium]|nr:hypothetical protein [bacterium]
MKNLEFKLKLVELTMKNCKEFAKDCSKKSKQYDGASQELKEYFEGEAKAFEMVAEWLEGDIE